MTGAENEIKYAAQLIIKSEYTIIFSGAGISTPSGIPDFRSVNSGLWQKYDPFEVASLTSFLNNPEIFYQWFRPLVRTICNAHPNQAHRSISDLQKAGYINDIITQNIDALHQRSGASTVHEIHGTMETLTCLKCMETIPSLPFLPKYIEHGTIPRCPICSTILKPDVVLLEEQLPEFPWSCANQAIEKTQLMIIAGSSLVVTPAASLPIIALDHGAKLLVINRSPTYIDNNASLILNKDVAKTFKAIKNEIIQNQ